MKIWLVLAEIEESGEPSNPGGTMDLTREIYHPKKMDERIRNAWNNKPPHYGGRFPALEAKVQELAHEISLEFLGLDTPIFVRVNASRQAWARWTTDPYRAYITIPKFVMNGHRFDLRDGTPFWVVELIHEIAHIECYRWYRNDINHGDVFQTVERQILNAYAFEPEYTRTPGYWRRLYDLDGNLLKDFVDGPVQRFAA